jgi:ubiquinone/menaquinone biosynthesis C-methylase UbiE
MTMKPDHRKVLRVTRSKGDAARYYSRLSRRYDAVTGRSERRHAAVAAQILGVTEGETILEIGFGTGHAVLEFARKVGASGQVYGRDLSAGMVELCRERVRDAGYEARVTLSCGDGLTLPYSECTFDAVFMSFTLELFDTPEMAPLLRQCHRVLKPDGRICVAAMAHRSSPGPMEKLYEWAHTRFPVLVDCRPIQVGPTIESAGFEISETIKRTMWGLPVDIVLAKKSVKTE